MVVQGRIKLDIPLNIPTALDLLLPVLLLLAHTLLVCAALYRCGF
jgi:hypothetical protein